MHADTDMFSAEGPHGCEGIIKGKKTYAIIRSGYRDGNGS
jgi:hypothetical protein